jgi:hypothetical protein
LISLRIRDFHVFFAERFIKSRKPLLRLFNRQGGNFTDMAGVDFNGQRLWLQAVTAAGRAGLFGFVLVEVFAHMETFRLQIAAVHIGNDAFEGIGAGEVFIAIPVFEGEFFFPAAVQNNVAQFLRQFVPARVHVRFEMRGQTFQRLFVIAG